MSTTITGTVIAVTKGKPYTSKVGPLAGKTMVTNKILIETDSGQVTVQKNSMATTNFTLASGTKVQATYDERTVNTQNGDSFVNNNLVKDGLLVLSEDGAALQVGSTGAPKPAFTPGGHGGHSGSSSSSGQKTKAAYDSDGARNGMIIKAALDLATARKDVSLASLLLAADDIKSLTKYVEDGVTSIAATKASASVVAKSATVPTKTVVKELPKTKPQVYVEDEDDSSPFD